MGIHHDILGYFGVKHGKTNNKPSIWGLFMDKNNDFVFFFGLFYLIRGEIIEEYLSVFFLSRSDNSTIDVYGKRHHPPSAEVFRLVKYWVNINNHDPWLDINNSTIV